MASSARHDPTGPAGPGRQRPARVSPGRRSGERGDGMARAADQEPETAPGAGGPAAPQPDEPKKPNEPAQENPAGKPPAKKRRPAKVVTEWVAIIAVALVLALAARQWVFQTFSIPSESMVPTLDVGDRIVVQKIFWNWHDVKQ